MVDAAAGDPRATADAAGLRYVSDRLPGIRRRRAGRGFSYRGTDGRPVRDPGTLTRIRRLAVPPAWTDVWICTLPNGHLQATGRDARGRKQYRYHADWRRVRDEAKYDRLLAFGMALPSIRAQVSADLARHGLERERIVAAVVRLLDTTLIRVGNEEYARENDSFGLTTLRSYHVRVDGSRLLFRFRGKSGKRQAVATRDRRLAVLVRRLQELPGQVLFQYLDGDGAPRVVASDDVNRYLGRVSGQPFTAKDFRTWAGSVLALHALGRRQPPGSEREARRRLRETVEWVARLLGNTPAVLRQSYLHPAVVDGFRQGRLPQPPAVEPAGGLRGEERALLELLDRD